MAEADPKLLWTPSAEWIERTTLNRYQSWLSETRELSFDGYHDLWRWSVFDLEEFWSSLVEFAGVRFSEPPARVLGNDAMPGASWFPGARLSYAEHMFAGKDPDALAIQHASESRELASMTWGELRGLTASIAAGLRASGVGEGDRVVAYMPNIPETVAALFACASIGAVWSSAAPEFGVRSVVDRFSQIEPKVLLAVDGYRYGGKDFDRRDAVDRIAAEIPSLSRVVRLGYLAGSGWEDGFLGPSDSLEFAQLPFDHPLWVLYSSGTTGLPKPIVHGQGGILLEHLKKALLHLDAQAGDRLFWFTTTGWMMWNFIVGMLLSDASIVLFDGNPGYPSLATLWDLAADSGMTCFGTSAAFIGACMKDDGLTLRSEGRDLSALRSVGSTGSPLSPEGFQWIYDQLGSDTWLFSTSGGTDLCTAFVGGVPTLPVYLGELQARALGAAVESWDPEGRPLIEEVGELVITRPMPSMPVFFWGDDSGERYRDSYFSVYPGVWRHGDWIEITSRETAVIYGRSDSTINRGGVRMGTSEIYRAVLGVDDVIDALVVDVPREGAEAWMPLFVVLREGQSLSDDLITDIRRRVREDCSPRHVPDEIRQIDEVPRTLSGKVLEVPVKRILMGTPVEQAASRESLANPEALDYFVALGGENQARTDS
ncbi:MAG TPA: acetoacetate--CoA ligase [Solirubrobacteraceae bacterium]|nr:acetoacetate--CoA ligase [Solirubrobacteraceae bacterium]